MWRKQSPSLLFSPRIFVYVCIHICIHTDPWACMLRCLCVLNHFSHVWLFMTLWTVAHQAPMSMEFSSQEHWSGLLCPPDLPDLQFNPCRGSQFDHLLHLLHWQADSLPLSHLGSPHIYIHTHIYVYIHTHTHTYTHMPIMCNLKFLKTNLSLCT